MGRSSMKLLRKTVKLLERLTPSCNYKPLPLESVVAGSTKHMARHVCISGEKAEARGCV